LRLTCHAKALISRGDRRDRPARCAAVLQKPPYDSRVLYHLTTRSAWQRAVAIGDYLTMSLEVDGFIHLSTETQWPAVRERLFADVAELVLLVIDPARLRNEIKFELADGDHYPHLYGPLDVSAVIEVREL
jgi:uncharacterized protein (DUF952 family)